MKQKSDFGKGFTYCLGLFLAHAERYDKDKEMYKKIKSLNGPGMWFYAAVDHLHELTLPNKISKKLKEKVDYFVSFCYTHRGFHNEVKVTEKDVYWAIDEAKELLRLIDAELLEVETVGATWK